MRLALFRLVVGALVAVVAKPVFADSFKFEYSFASADVHVTGTFTGVQNGAFVENISDVTLALDGIVIPVTFFSARLDDSFVWMGGPIVSFNALYNNFAFSNTDLVSGDQDYSHLFFMLYDTVWLGTQFQSPEVLVSFDNPDEMGAWKLTNLSTPTSVPDAGMTAMMLLLALVGLRLMRRQTAA